MAPRSSPRGFAGRSGGQGPFLDRLNRLEQLKIIDSKEQWLNLKNMRNTLAHEYEDDPEGMSVVLNLVYESYHVLMSIFCRPEIMYCV